MTEQEFRNFLALGLCIEGLAGVREPVAYLYGGLRLPKIPVVDGYSYALIKDSRAAVSIYDAVDVYLFNSIAYKSSGGNPCAYIDMTKGDPLRYACYTGTATWKETHTGTSGTMDADQWTVWANFDIPTPDGTGVAIEASDPIPVYE